MDALFWIATVTVFYIYIGYPLILRLLPQSHLSQNHLAQSSSSRFSDQSLPTVTVIIAAFNEANCIEQTLHNKISQDYPQDKLDIIVVSDGSTDATNARVQALAAQYPQIRLLIQAVRQGKTAALNRAILEANGEIIVFSDANSIYQREAIRHLVDQFSDPSVGYVTGKMVYINSDGTLVGDGCSAYMKYENYVRSQETRIGSIVGVDGGIDAIRKALYRPLKADQLPDFVQPLSVIEQGARVVYCDKALLNEETTSAVSTEFSMRVRVSLRAYWAMWDMKRLFNPFKFGLFSWQLLSHKLLRYLAFIPLLVAFICNIGLLEQGSIYYISFIAQCLFYSLALLAHWGIFNGNSVSRLAYYFCVLNVASLIAFLYFLRRKKIVVWQPRGGAA